jgi:glycosyltransferase involved in cell wall biosynthesis
MPVYNGERFLAESIGSVLGQTFHDLELVLIDDGSTDQSWKIVQEFQSDRRLRAIRFEQNRGAAMARNAGVSSTESEYVAFLDSDDLAEPNRLEIQVQQLTRNRQFDVVASQTRVLQQGVEARAPFARTAPNQVPATLLFRNCIVQSSVLMRRRCWQPYRTEFEPAEDYDLWARLAVDHSFLILSDVLVTYRDHGEGVSNRFPEKMVNAVKNIHRFQLERLGVAPQEEIHRRLTVWPVDSTAADLQAAETWLLELLSANRIYDPDSMKRVVEWIWFTICLDSWSLGPEAFRIYRRSRLATLTPTRLWQFMRRFGRRSLQS